MPGILTSTTRNPLYCSPCHKTPWKNGAASPRSTAKWATSKSGISPTQINDLTPTAQQILRDELKKRGISEKLEHRATSRTPQTATLQQCTGTLKKTRNQILTDRSGGSIRDYTWKTATLPLRFNR